MGYAGEGAWRVLSAAIVFDPAFYWGGISGEVRCGDEMGEGVPVRYQEQPVSQSASTNHKRMHAKEQIGPGIDAMHAPGTCEEEDYLMDGEALSYWRH